MIFSRAFIQTLSVVVGFQGVSLTYNARNEDDVEPVSLLKFFIYKCTLNLLFQETVKAFVCKTSSTFASTIRGGGGHSIADLDTLDPKPVVTKPNLMSK